MDARQKLQVAVTEGLLVNINEVLACSPSAIIQENSQGFTVLYEAAFAGKFEVVNFLLSHPAYHALMMPEKQALLRELVDAGVCSAQDIYLKGDFYKASQILEKTLYYNKKIIDKDDADYSMFGYALCLSASIHLKEKRWDKVFEVLQEAIFIQKKTIYKSDSDYHRLIFCLNALARCYAKKQKFDEAIKALKAALCHCQALSSEYESKFQLEMLLKNNVASLCRSALGYEARLWGYEGKQTNGKDGQSLLGAIIEQLKLQGFILNAELAFAAIYKLQAEHFNQNIALYRDDLGSKKIHDYFRRLVGSGIWAWEDALNVISLSRLLNVNLVIIRYDAEPPIVLKQAQAEVTLYLGLESGQVYQSLSLDTERTPGRSIKEYVEAGLIDSFQKTSFEKGYGELYSDASTIKPEQKRTPAPKTLLEEADTMNQYDIRVNQPKSKKGVLNKRSYTDFSRNNNCEYRSTKRAGFFKTAKASVQGMQPDCMPLVSLKVGK